MLRAPMGVSTVMGGPLMPLLQWLLSEFTA
jgi:hypothetical protein